MNKAMNLLVKSTARRADANDLARANLDYLPVQPGQLEKLQRDNDPDHP